MCSSSGWAGLWERLEHLQLHEYGLVLHRNKPELHQKSASPCPGWFDVIESPNLKIPSPEFKGCSVPECLFLVTMWSTWITFAPQPQSPKHPPVSWRSHLSTRILEKWDESIQCKLTLDRNFLSRERLMQTQPLFLRFYEIPADANNRFK